MNTNIKVIFSTFNRPNGDGSNTIKFFATALEAEKAAKAHFEEYGGRYRDDVNSYELTFENGILVSSKRI